MCCHIQRDEGRRRAFGTPGETRYIYSFTYVSAGGGGADKINAARPAGAPCMANRTHPSSADATFSLSCEKSDVSGAECNLGTPSAVLPLLHPLPPLFLTIHICIIVVNEAVVM